MTHRSVSHATIVIERTYDASPARVFAAWATAAAKRRWFACHEEWQVTEFELDFRIGGVERMRSGPPGGTVHEFEGRYYDIVPQERIVYSYDMRLDGTRISVSLATVELKPKGKSTRLVFTEQGTFLDGQTTATERDHGTRAGLDKLSVHLEGE